MAFAHGKSTVVLVDGNDLSTYLRDVSVSASVDTADTTTFSSIAKTYIPGHADASASASGIYDGSLNAVDEVLSGALGGDTKRLLTVLRDTAGAAARADLMQADTTGYDISSPVADVVSISASFQGSEASRTGVLLNSFVGVTSSTTHSGVDNGASTSGGYVAHLHVTGNARNGSTTVVVEHSTDNSTWTTLATFSAVGSSTTGAERKSGTGTVNRYVRARSTLGGTTGSVTYAVAFSRL